ncbi:MAG: GDP-mannose 4,6-dehydratase [Candidatus Riflebacteria bacterium]|nr:GDP-mannose 4,6-dehydratase [Candidatus Riflebacteria bacterium]
MKKKAIVTGITGQDGSYLAELLLEKGYEVYGFVKRVSLEDTRNKLTNIMHIVDSITLNVATLDNPLSLVKLFQKIQPDECYHLAASSFVSYSFDDEISILNSNLLYTHYLLASIKEFSPQCRFYFAGSSEMFGDAPYSPQDEKTPFNPRSIYGISKLAGYHLVRNFRKQYGLYASAGILYNHESPRRGSEFVTRKIASAVARIKHSLQEDLYLGNLDAQRDWGYSPDYVKAMWQILQIDSPDDFVVASGETHSVRDFVDLAFSFAGLDYKKYVKIDDRLLRQSESVVLCGNPSKIQTQLNWKRTKKFPEIVEEMVLSELKKYETAEHK